MITPASSHVSLILFSLLYLLLLLLYQHYPLLYLLAFITIYVVLYQCILSHLLDYKLLEWGSHISPLHSSWYNAFHMNSICSIISIKLNVIDDRKKEEIGNMYCRHRYHAKHSCFYPTKSLSIMDVA